MTAADHGAADDEAPQAGQEEYVDERLALRAHPRGVEAVSQVLSRERALLGQRALDHADGALGGRGLDALLGQSPRVAREQGGVVRAWSHG